MQHWRQRRPKVGLGENSQPKTRGIDGCVDEAPTFFKLLPKYWLGKVFVISYRSDCDKAVADL